MTSFTLIETGTPKIKRGTDPSVVVGFYVQDDDADHTTDAPEREARTAEVMAFLIDEVPALFLGMQRHHFEIELISSNWHANVQVTYGSRLAPEPGYVRVITSGNGGRATIRRGLSIYDSAKLGDDKSWLRSGQDAAYGSVDTSTILQPNGDTDGGIEKPQPGGKLTIETYLPQSVMGDNVNKFVRERQLLIGRVNSRKMLGAYLPHELELESVDHDSERIAIGETSDEPLSRLSYVFNVSFGYLYDAAAEDVVDQNNLPTTGLILGSLPPLWTRGHDFLREEYERRTYEGTDPAGNTVQRIGQRLIGATSIQLAREFDPKVLRIGV